MFCLEALREGLSEHFFNPRQFFGIGAFILAQVSLKVLADLFKTVKTLGEHLSVVDLPQLRLMLLAGSLLVQVSEVASLQLRVELGHHAGNVVALLSTSLQQDHLRDMGTEMLQAEETTIDTERLGLQTFAATIGHMAVSLRPSSNVLKKVLCVANFERELVLESLDQQGQQVRISLLEQQYAFERGVLVEASGQGQIHQDWNHDFEAEVEVEEFVRENGSHDL